MISDFFVIPEEWNRYKLLPDKVSLRIRMSPVSFNVEGLGKVNVEFGQILNKSPKEGIRAPSQNQSIGKGGILKALTYERVFESLKIRDVPSVRQIMLCKHSLLTFP